MQVKILLFASLKDHVGTNRATLEVPSDATLADARAALASLYPQAEAHIGAAIGAVNQEYAENTARLQDGDEIAFFPPVSGGSGNPVWPEIIRLEENAIDHDAVVTSITTPATGAVCLFSGMVRGKTSREGELVETASLHYEAYEPMALAKMRQVAAEIRERWPLVQGIAIIQRVGHLEVGQNTIVIACSSGHRDQGCFEGARYGIDRLKEIVPVWKQEISAAGTAWVEGHYLPGQDDRQP